MDEQLEIIRLLLQRGADPTVIDVAARTPRDWAKNERIMAALGADARPTARAQELPAQSARRRGAAAQHGDEADGLRPPLIAELYSSEPGFSMSANGGKARPAAPLGLPGRIREIFGGSRAMGH